MSPLVRTIVTISAIDVSAEPAVRTIAPSSPEPSSRLLVARVQTRSARAASATAVAAMPMPSASPRGDAEWTPVASANVIRTTNAPATASAVWASQ